MTSQPLIVYIVIVSDGSEKNSVSHLHLSISTEANIREFKASILDMLTKKRGMQGGEHERGERALLNKFILNATSCFLLRKALCRFLATPPLCFARLFAAY